MFLCIHFKNMLLKILDLKASLLANDLTPIKNKIDSLSSTMSDQQASINSKNSSIYKKR